MPQSCARIQKVHLHEGAYLKFQTSTPLHTSQSECLFPFSFQTHLFTLCVKFNCVDAHRCTFPQDTHKSISANDWPDISLVRWLFVFVFMLMLLAAFGKHFPMSLQQKLHKKKHHQTTSSKLFCVNTSGDQDGSVKDCEHSPFNFSDLRLWQNSHI